MGLSYQGWVIRVCEATDTCANGTPSHNDPNIYIRVISC